jgi:hypothetical protein
VHQVGDKKIICVFCLPLQCLSETFHILGSIYQDVTINVDSLRVKYRCSYHILIKLLFSRQIFDKILKYQIFLKIHLMGVTFSTRTDKTN